MDYKICRLCLTNHREKALLKIFGQEGLDDVIIKLQSCLPFKVSVFDGKPKYICYNCMALLDQTYKFIRNAIHSNEILQKNVSGTGNKAIADASGEMCADNNDDTNYGEVGRIHSSITIERHRHSTWVLSQHSQSESSDEDGSLELEPTSHRIQQALLEQEVRTERSPESTQNSSQPHSLEKTTQESMLSEQGKKHTSPMDITSQSKVQKIECKQLIPSYPSAFQQAVPIPYPFNMYQCQNNHSVYHNNTPQIQSGYIPNSSYQVPIQLINNSTSSNVGYQYVSNTDGNVQLSNNVYSIPPNTPQIPHTYFSNPNGYNIQNHNLSYTPHHSNTTLLNGNTSTQLNSYPINPNMCCQIPNTSHSNQTVTSQTVNSNNQNPICYTNSENVNSNTTQMPMLKIDSDDDKVSNIPQNKIKNNQITNSKNEIKPIKNVTTIPNPNNNQELNNGNNQILKSNSDINPIKSDSQSSMKSISQENKENVMTQKISKSPVTPNNKPLTDNNLTPIYENSCGLDLNFCNVCKIMLSPHENIFTHMLHSHENLPKKKEL